MLCSGWGRLVMWAKQQFGNVLTARPSHRAFMSKATLAVTGALVLVHSIFGCCGDHMHFGQSPNSSSCCSSKQATSSACTGHSHRQTKPAKTSGGQVLEQQNPTDSHQHQCLHDSCQWIVQRDSADAVSHLMDIACMHAAIQSATEALLDLANGGLSEPAHAFAPPLRLHLRVGVLLI